MRYLSLTSILGKGRSLSMSSALIGTTHAQVHIPHSVAVGSVYTFQQLQFKNNSQICVFRELTQIN